MSETFVNEFLVFPVHVLSLFADSDITEFLYIFLAGFVLSCVPLLIRRLFY